MNKLLIAIGLIALTGVGCATSGPSVPVPELSPIAVALGTSATFSIGERIAFQDGTALKLTAINDSRCPADVQCIWAGELSPVFMFYDVDKSYQEVILGTSRTPSVTVKNYTITLTAASTDEATVTVSKN